MKYRWVMRSVDDEERVRAVQRQLNDLPEPLARALVLRGIDTFEAAKHYFRPSLDHLHDPFLMQDMEAAADRVAEAIERGERVLVYGDYDVDGTTSTALMTSFLRSQGVDASYFIPDRIEHGYGLSEAGIDHAAEVGASLIVALDCGITAHEQAAYARRQGLDLIICDHHTPHATVPDALAVLDPKRSDCDYPFKELSGCGVGFKLVQAVCMRLGYPAEHALRYLDLVAVSIAADIVPVHGENRVLMREGLEALRGCTRPGIRALAREIGLDLHDCTSSRIVFTIGPRINAAGRMGDAGRAVELMLAEDDDVAERLAKELDAVNMKRRELDEATRVAARAQAERQITASTRHVLVLYDEDWHPGVIGIVASRIVERYYRPTVMLTRVNGVVKGSARSILGVNIYDALTACEDLLTQFGGHDYAAGLSLPEENVPVLRERLNEVVGEMVTPEVLIPAIEVDAELDLRELDGHEGRFWKVLKQFAPYGPDNLAPVFQARDLGLSGLPRTVGRDDKHVKFRVRQRTSGANGSLDVIGFNMAKHMPKLQQSLRDDHPLELLFTVEENTWQGRTTLQLKAKDVRLQEE